MKTIEESGKVSFSQSVKDFFTGYFDFRGRSTRAGFWWSQLCIALIYIILFVIMAVDSSSRSYYDTSTMSTFLGFILIIFSLAIIIPLLSLCVRRLRDIGLKSKTILALYVLYYGFYGTYIAGMYSSVMNSASSIIAQYSESYTTPIMQISSSPLITFFFMMLSAFLFISLFLPTDMLATKSKNPILQSIFASK